MLWKGRRQSTNVDDRRGISGGGVAAGGGIIGVIIFLLYTFLGGGGGDPTNLPQMIPGTQKEMTAEEKAADEQRAEFVKVVFADTEDIWNKILGDQEYQEPTLVLFRDGVQSACGSASSAVGP